MTDPDLARWESEGGLCVEPSLSRLALAVEQLNRAIPALRVAAKLLDDDGLEADQTDWMAAKYIVVSAERLRDRLLEVSPCERS